MPLRPADAALVQRGRNLVLNLMVLEGVGIALSGLILRNRQVGASTWPMSEARPTAYAALIGLVVLSFVVRRGIGSRPRLRDPRTRPRRFLAAHLAGAALGALAIPLGFAYAYAVRPTLDSILPFWASALILGFLCLPREDALEGLDPLPDSDLNSHATNEPGSS